MIFKIISSLINYITTTRLETHNFGITIDGNDDKIDVVTKEKTIGEHKKLLRRGDVFKKYNKMWSANRRYVWWDEEENAIKWRPLGNKKKSAEKGIVISEITDVRTDKSGKTESGKNLQNCFFSVINLFFYVELLYRVL